MNRSMVDAIAAESFSLLCTRRQAASFSGRYPDLDLPKAYRCRPEATGRAWRGSGLFRFGADEGTKPMCDQIGLEFPDDQAEHEGATEAMGEMARDFLPQAGSPKNITMWVRNQQGKPVLQVALTFTAAPARRGSTAAPE